MDALFRYIATPLNWTKVYGQSIEGGSVRDSAYRKSWYTRTKEDYLKAEETNRRPLEGIEKALGVEHPKTLASVYCFACLFHTQQQYHDAFAKS